MILAFAARTASVLVGCFCCDGSVAFPAAGIIGSTCVGIIEARSTGCVLIGPVGCLLLGIVDVLIVIAAEKPKGRLERRPLYCYSTISTMRRVRGSTKTVRPFTTV